MEVLDFSWGTVYVGNDAQSMFSQLQKTMSSNSEKDNEEEDCCGGSIASYRHKESPKETDYYRANKGTKNVVNEAAYEAGMLATTVGGGDIGGDNDGYSGAIRHAYWMYLIAISLGPERAETIGLLHEDFIITRGKYKGMNNIYSEDSKMDMINNAWGINMARENPNLTDVEFEELFYRAVQSQNGTIKIIDTKTVPKSTLKERFKSLEKTKERLRANGHRMMPSIKW
ncbi:MULTISPECIES: hypothetical protein [Flavobacterium]|uniref:DUF6973 domain-containing protein n=1 Tax=Flavobacterium TaxID=237 RepID=UPI001F1BDEE1|nr:MULTISPECIES: hypothetical protein [Flavobacterium]